MTQRIRILPLGVGFCVALMPACLGTRGDRAPLERRSPAPALTARAETPYQPNPVPPPPPESDMMPQQDAPSPRTEMVAQAPNIMPPAAPTTPVATVGLPRSPGGAEAQTVPPAPARSEDRLLRAVQLYRDNRKEEALAQLRELDASSRELLALLLPLSVQLSDKAANKPAPGDLSGLLDRFEKVATRLRPQAALTISKSVFCSDILGYGQYEPLPANHSYQAGTGGRPGGFVQVYVELAHFLCQKKDPYFETTLSSTVSILDYQGQEVCRIGQRPHLERSRSPRRDCFLNCFFYVPPQLPAGSYVLRIEIRDMTGVASTAKVPPHRIASCTLDFQLGTVNAATQTERGKGD